MAKNFSRLSEWCRSFLVFEENNGSSMLSLQEFTLSEVLAVHSYVDEPDSRCAGNRAGLSLHSLSSMDPGFDQSSKDK